MPKPTRKNLLSVCIIAGLIDGFSAHARVSRVMGAADGNLPAIRPLMVLRPSAAAAGEYELLIYGDIGESWWGESVTALSIVQQLQALPAGTTQINVRINSYGGSVSDGIAIYNALKRNAARKVVTIDGVAMSSASLIAMVGDEVQMPATSLLMIHAPWGLAQGNAQDMRVMADVLDTYADAMANAYAAKSGKPKADMLSLLNDGLDHYYTGEQAVADGFADALVDAVDDTEGDAAAADAAARAAGVQRFTARAPQHIAQMAIAAAARHPMALPKAGKPRVAVPAGMDITALQDALASASGQQALVAALTTAVSANDGDLTMKLRKLYAAVHDQVADPTDPGNRPGGNAAPSAAEIQAAAQTALRDRNTAIQAALKPVMEIPGVRALYEEALLDPGMTLDTINAKALALAGAGATPNRGTVDAGATQADKDVQAMSDWLLARAEAERLQGKVKLENAAPENPFRGYSLYAMAEHCVRARGVNTSRMNRGEIVAQAMRPHASAGLTTSDFPNLLENTLNKLLVAAYTGAPTTWQRIARVTDLVDFRANPRYRIGTFSGLKEVNESGDYEQGTISDAERESITAKRKGRILVVSREMIVNDDLQAFADVARGLGAVANRTVDMDVFALFALNSGAGPTMGDGNPLFHASHNNIAATAAAPGVAPFEAARVQMAQQMDPSGNDYLDIRPYAWLGPIGIGGSARVTNNSLYDPDAASKLQRPNIVNGLFSDIVDTPRLSGTAWYALASPDAEPVFEVGFVGGQRLPIVEQERDFDSDGLRWKVVLEYGVAATGWRGAVKNAGA